MGEWLKIEKSTPDKPELFMIAQETNLHIDAVLGKLFRIWAWFDTHTEDCQTPAETRPLLDKIVDHFGFCDAMTKVGWMEQKSGRLILPNFDRHNGKTAKERALTASRVVRHRERNATTVTKSLLEKKRKEKKRKEEDLKDKKKIPKKKKIEEL